MQLSAAGLGVPSGAQYGLADALREGTQGFMQGAQLKLQQDRSKREQAAYEQALKQAQFNLQQDQSQAQAAQQGGDLLGQVGNFQANQNVIGPPTEQGSLVPATAATHAQDYQGLLQHHQQVWGQAGQIASRIDPRYREQFLNDIRTGMAQDAMNLRRTHVSDTLHDQVMSGVFDPVDPTTGERVPNEQMRQYFSDLADKTKSGEIDPEQADQAGRQVALANLQKGGDVQARISIGNAAKTKLAETGGTPEQFSFVDSLMTGMTDIKSWQEKAPYVMAGFVPSPRGSGWLTPQDAAAEQAQMAAQTRNINANADYTENWKPVIEQSKVDATNARTEATRGMNLDRIKSEEKIAADKITASKEIAANRLAEQARKAATEAGFSDAKALDKALERTLQMYKEGLIDDKAFQPKVDELKAQFSTKKNGAEKPKVDTGGLIKSIMDEHPDWSDEQIRDEVKKRGG